VGGDGFGEDLFVDVAGGEPGFEPVFGVLVVGIVTQVAFNAPHEL